MVRLSLVGASPSAGAEDQRRVDGDQAPAVLVRGEPPRLPLRQGLGVGVGLSGQGGGRVPAALGHDPAGVARDVREVDGVAVHGRHRAGEDHTRDRGGLLHAGQDVAGALQRGGDEVASGVLHLAHEGRGGMNDDLAAGHGLVVGAGPQQVGVEEPQGARRLVGGAVQVGDLGGRVRGADSGVDGRARLQQALGDPAPQVAGGAGDGDRGARAHRHSGEVETAGWWCTTLSAHGCYVRCPLERPSTAEAPGRRRLLRFLVSRSTGIRRS